MNDRDGNKTSDHWETPDKLYNELNEIFHFDFDPCPLHADFDGLTIDWMKMNFVNPPYSRRLKPQFINKTYHEFKKGRESVLLIPAATGTKQFHSILKPYGHIIFIKGRLAFKGYNGNGEYTTTNKGKHDSMLVIFSKKYKPNTNSAFEISGN